jgi:uncharacterized protein (DUF2237 family)
MSTEEIFMRDRYWCCAEPIGGIHKDGCPQTDTEGGPKWEEEKQQAAGSPEGPAS